MPVPTRLKLELEKFYWLIRKLSLLSSFSGLYRSGTTASHQNTIRLGKNNTPSGNKKNPILQ
jgi:hypothetical protein